MAKNPLIRRKEKSYTIPLPNQSAGILDDFAVRKNINTKEGTIEHVPTDDNHIANKKYVDDNIGAGTWTDTSTNTGTNKTFDDFSNHIEADEIHEELRNESGALMTRGDAVYISGFSVGQTRALVSLADNDSASTMPAVAILEDATLANNATGHFIEIGSLIDMDTDSWEVGDDLYVSGVGTTTNTLTSTKPIGTSLIQKVAVVLRKHATNGIIEVFGAGRTNDLPNIANTKIWIGDTNGVPQEFALSGDATMTAGGVVTIDHVNINSIGTNTHAQIDTHITAGAAHIADVTGDPHAIAADTLIFTNKTIDGDTNTLQDIAISSTKLVAGTNITLSTDTLNVDDAFLKNDAVDVGVGLSLTGDNSSADTTYVPNVLYNTDATPPTASTTPIGTIYVQYTA